MFAVVSFLIADVIAEMAIFERRYAKCAIAVLPSELPPVRYGIMNPL